MRFINLTPHAVNVIAEDGTQILALPPSGTVARLEESAIPASDYCGINHTVVKLGSVTGLPEPAEGVIYIASMPLLMGMRAAGIERPDVVYPYGQVRDGSGRIIGCRSLASIARTS